MYTHVTHPRYTECARHTPIHVRHILIHARQTHILADARTPDTLHAHASLCTPQAHARTPHGNYCRFKTLRYVKRVGGGGGGADTNSIGMFFFELPKCLYPNWYVFFLRISKSLCPIPYVFRPKIPSSLSIRLVVFLNFTKAHPSSSWSE